MPPDSLSGDCPRGRSSFAPPHERVESREIRAVCVLCVLQCVLSVCARLCTLCTHRGREADVGSVRVTALLSCEEILPLSYFFSARVGRCYLARSDPKASKFRSSLEEGASSVQVVRD